MCVSGCEGRYLSPKSYYANLFCFPLISFLKLLIITKEQDCDYGNEYLPK